MTQREAIINLKPGGTPNISGWRLGEQIVRVADMAIGQVVLAVSEQFDAQNLVLITKRGNGIATEAEIAYGRFVDPADGSSPRVPGDDTFAIWDFQVAASPLQRYFQVTRSVTPSHT